MRPHFLWRVLIVIALGSACKDKPAHRDEARGSSEAGSATAVSTMSDAEIAALRTRFDALADSDAVAESVAVGAKLVEVLRAQKPASPDLVYALTMYGRQLLTSDDRTTARAVLEEALAHPEAKASGLLGEIQFELSVVYTEPSEEEKAIGLLRSAIQLTADAEGPDSVRVAHMKSSLALLYHGSEQRLDAEKLLREALASFEKSGESRLIGHARNELAENLVAQDRDAEALQLYLRAAQELANATDVDRFDLADSYTNMADIYLRQKKGKLAIAALRKALAADIDVVGPEDPIVAFKYYNLAEVLRDQHALGEARAMCAKALAIRRALDDAALADSEQLCAELAKKK